MSGISWPVFELAEDRARAAWRRARRAAAHPPGRSTLSSLLSRRCAISGPNSGASTDRCTLEHLLVDRDVDGRHACGRVRAASSMSKSLIASLLRNAGGKRKLSAAKHGHGEEIERGALLGRGDRLERRAAAARVVGAQREAADVLGRLQGALLHLEQTAVEVAAQERVVLAVLERRVSGESATARGRASAAARRTASGSVPRSNVFTRGSRPLWYSASSAMNASVRLVAERSAMRASSAASSRRRELR